MSVELGERSLRILDNQLGLRILIFISPMTRSYEIFWQDIHGRFIKKLDSIKVCSIFSVSYCESTYSERNMLIDIMKCRDIHIGILKTLVPIPSEVYNAYAYARATGDYGEYYKLVKDILTELRGKLEDRINEMIKFNYAEMDNIIANFFNSQLLDYGTEIGNWITGNPLYEEHRLYGEYCHNCFNPKCNDIERVVITEKAVVIKK